MKHETGKFGGSGGARLFWQHWQPQEPSCAVLAIIHGYGEHSGRYGAYVEHLVPHGYALYGFDLRGHGQSPGQRGHVMSWDEFRADVLCFVQLVREREPGKPLILLGHSMGGLIVLNFALHHPEGLSGVIASAPALSQTAVSPALMFLAKVLSCVLPSFSMESRLDGTAISRDPETVATYREDPLLHGRGSARLATEMSRTMAWTNAHAGDWGLPLLVLHGTHDRIVPYTVSRIFFEAVPVQDKEFVGYEGGYHEPHNDIDKDRVMQDVADWLDRHTGRCV